MFLPWFFLILGRGNTATPTLLRMLRMNIATHIANRVFSLTGPEDFGPLALEVFHFQYEHNAVYRRFCQSLGWGPGDVSQLEDIPFLPVELFKSRRVVSFSGSERLVFESSGTGGGGASRHFVFDPEVYRHSYMQGFRFFYGEPSDYCILALLPSYLERQGSSLVYMASGLIEASGHPLGGFYLSDLHRLSGTIGELMATGQRLLLLGVSFALLDLAAAHPMPLHNAIVMETGGMKGRRREMVREELHGILCHAFSLEKIHSEYGMTELFSQAYSAGGGRFACPPWMRVLVREDNDPLAYAAAGRAGGINVVDLSNLYSCSFIATQDLGRLLPGGQFEVLGRFDHSDVRGCNLMVET